MARPDGEIPRRADAGRAASPRRSRRCTGALLFGWFAVRLSGVYLAMLTLAFAQIVWSILFQWEGVTGGSNGILGIWPQAPFDSRAGLLSADARARGRGRPAAAPFPVRAVRLRHAGRARLSAARGSDRHQRQARALDRLCHRRRVRRHRRRGLRLRQGDDLARCGRRLALDRRPWSWCCWAASRH